MNTPAVLGSILLVLLFIAGVFCTLIVLRLRALYRRVGSFECGISTDGRQWKSGIAVFGAHYISWYRTSSMSRKPVYSFSRSHTHLVSQKHQDTDSGTVVAVIVSNGQQYYVGMSQEALSGFVSWMESASPEEEPTRI